MIGDEQKEDRMYNSALCTSLTSHTVFPYRVLSRLQFFFVCSQCKLLVSSPYSQVWIEKFIILIFQFII